MRPLKHLGLALGLLFPVIVSASGIDWENSIMMVEFSPESNYVPSFSCFGYTDRNTATSHFSACNGYAGPESHCVWEDLATLGYDDENNDPEIDDCFQQAGNYKTSIYLIDYALNTQGPDVSEFLIKAGPPDSDISELEVDTTCTDLSVAANGINTCNITLKVKDEFGNPVTQLKNQTGTVYSDSSFASDANSGDYDFRGGTKINGITIPDSTGTPIGFSINNNDEVTATLALSAWAPSIRKVGDYLGKNETFNYAFTFEVPGVDEDGDLDLTNPVTLQYNQFTPSIGFAPWAKTILENMVTPPAFILDTQIPFKLVRNVVAPTSGGPNNLVSIFLKTVNLPSGLYFEGVSFDPTSIDTTQQETIIYPTLKVASAGSVISGSVSFASDIAYDIIDNGVKTIRYPSGAVGVGFGQDCVDADDCDDTAIELGSVGASIEGKLVGEKDKGILQDFNTVRLGNIDSVEDIREEVFANAFIITRSAAPILQSGEQALSFNSSWFTNNDVAYVENADVKIGSSGSTTNLPAGKKTLVIRNGNLIIEGDIAYSDNLDSFGFILVNDLIAQYPDTGNIFVKNNVKRMVGTIFAEGTLATIPSTTIVVNDGDVTPDDISNGQNASNDTQLLFEGTLLTHNTLGGAYLIQFDTNYFTPWGDTTGTTPTDRALAEKYDLHFMRYYQPVYSGGVQLNVSDCVSGSDPYGCDRNPNAFVIRYDGKAVKLAPPGFEGASFFGR